MYLEPHEKQVVGRIVDVVRTKGGLDLPDGNVKNVTVFMLVEAIGPDVTRVKAKDVALYKECSHCWLRDGTHYVLVEEKNVLATVHGLDLERCKIHGEPEKEKSA